MGNNLWRQREEHRMRNLMYHLWVSWNKKEHRIYLHNYWLHEKHAQGGWPSRESSSPAIRIKIAISCASTPLDVNQLSTICESTSKFTYLKEKYYIHNIFITFSQQILNDRLLVIIASGQKSNLSCGFKLKPIYQLWFVVKVL